MTAVDETTGQLNTTLIQKELVSALAEDREYHITDEAKKKYITKAGTYDEFRHMVACADLKRVSRADLDSLSQPVKGWENRSALATGQKKGKRGRRTTGRRVNSTTNKLSTEFPAAPPTSSMAFERDWRRHGLTMATKLSYLELCGAANFRTIFKTDLDVGLLGKIVQTFAERAQCTTACTSEDLQAASFALDFLEAVVQTGRFSLNVNFLCDADQANVQVVFDWLTASAALQEDGLKNGQAAQLPTDQPSPDISTARISAVKSMFGA